MAGFDAATVQLQRELLATTHRDLARDRRLLDKQPLNSRSKMAQTLRERIATGSAIVRDLQQLIASMESAAAEPVLDARAQWIADGHAMLAFIEANPDLPLPNGETTYSAFPRGTDDDERDEVRHVADILGAATTEHTPGHLVVEHRIGRHTYQVLAITKARMERGRIVQQLGEAALAGQGARAESAAGPHRGRPRCEGCPDCIGYTDPNEPDDEDGV